MSYSSVLGSTLIKEDPSTIITGAIGYKYSVVLTPGSTASFNSWVSSGITLPEGIWAILGTTRVQASSGNLTGVLTGIYKNGSETQLYTVASSAVTDGPTISGLVTSDGNDVIFFRITAFTSGANWEAGGNTEDRQIFVVRVA